ncbi:MAG TPA: hypothetical protein VIV66_04195 [Pyrinomonadaceae bacterium]
MKRFIFVILFVLCATAPAGTQSYTTAGTPGPSHKESAVVVFKTPVKLMDVLLQGEYLFVHDDAMMVDGNACTSVFKLVAGNPVELVASFHCIPVVRPRANHFTMRSSLVSSNSKLYELQEFQFAGSNEGHQVPARMEANMGVVDLVGCCP